MKRGAKFSLFDKKILQIFDKAKGFFSFRAEQIIDGTKKVIDDVKAAANELQGKYSAWVNFRIPEEFLRGADTLEGSSLEKELIILESLPIAQATEQLDRIIARKLSRGNIETLQDVILEAEAYNKNALNSLVGRFQQLSKKTTDPVIADIIAGPKTTSQKASEVASLLKTQGVTYLQDAGGRKRSMDRYAQMLVRTETQKSYNYGIVQKGIEYGYTKFERLESIDCCPICQPHRGEIWDVTKQGLPPAIYHPNCRGSWTTYK